MREDDAEDRRKTRFTVRHHRRRRPERHHRGLASSRSTPSAPRSCARADIRWINLGPTDRGGSTRHIAGQEVAAPLFDACRHCGVVPAAQRGVRDRADARHRGWCRQRREPDPDGWVTVALTHELRTQAVRLLVPPIVVADATVRTSFRAALLLGLRRGARRRSRSPRRRRGRRSRARQQRALGDGAARPRARRHRLPGRFADPDRVRELLEAALAVLVACPARGRARRLPPLPAAARAAASAAEARRESAIDLIRRDPRQLAAAADRDDHSGSSSGRTTPRSRSGSGR